MSRKKIVELESALDSVLFGRKLFPSIFKRFVCMQNDALVIPFVEYGSDELLSSEDSVK